MPDLNNILAIFLKDLRDLLKSKTVWIFLLTPVVISLLFAFASSPPRMAVYEEAPAVITRSLDSVFTLKRVDSPEKVKQIINRKQAAVGLIIPAGFDRDVAENKRPKLTLLIDETNSKQSAVIVAVVKELVRQQKGQKLPVKLETSIARQAYLVPQQEMVPYWVIIVVAGSLMIVTTSLIEEKEKKTLQAILVSPASFEDVIIGKGLLGMTLTTAGVFLLLILNKSLTGDLLAIIVLVLLSSAFFTAWGILVGLVSNSQATGSAVNSVAYLVFLLPVMLADFSDTMYKTASYLPTFYLTDGLSKAMLGEKMGFHFLGLLFYTLLLFIACQLLMRRLKERG